MKTIAITEKELPEIKGWKDGESYILELYVTQTSKGNFSIQKIEAESQEEEDEEGEDTMDEDMEDESKEPEGKKSYTRK